MFVDLDTTFARASPTSPGRSSRRRSRRRPATCGHGERTLPRIRPFLVNSRGCSPTSSPGTALADGSAGTIAAAARAGVPVLRATPKLNAQLPPTAAALRRLQRRHGVSARASAGSTDLNERSSPPLQLHRPGADGLQLRDAAVPQRGELAEPGRRASATGSGSSPFEHARPGPNNEGSPSSAPANGGGVRCRATSSTSTPTRTPPRRARPDECEAGNEPYIDGPAGDRQRPRQPGDHDRGPDRRASSAREAAA